MTAHTPLGDLAPPTPMEMRRAMGNFATGVTIVTGQDAEGPFGFACQSFASVSLEPPLVLFCADHGGRAWPRIRETGRFTVNVLGEDQADECSRFGSSRGLKFDGLEHEASPIGTPSLHGALLRVHCEVDAVHVAGDHDIVVGRVLGLETPRSADPMVFFRGRFSLVDPASEVLAQPDFWGWS